MAPIKTIDFEKIFQISLTALKINRSHPDIPRNMKWFLQFLIIHGFYTLVFCVLSFNVYLGIRDKNYIEASQNCIIAVVYEVVSFQYLILIVKQDTIAKILHMMKLDYTKALSEVEREIVFIYAKRGKKVCMQWLLLVSYATFLFPAKHIYLELYTYVMDDWKLFEMYPLTYPTFIEDNKKNPVVYAVLYLSILYYMLYSTVMMTCFAPLGSIFMLHACGQLEIVKRHIKCLYVEKSTKEIELKLNDIVRNLQYIYGFVEKIIDAFAVVYELSMMVTTITLPLTVFGVLESINSGQFNIEFTTFIFTGILFSSFPCYYSDLLMEKGEEVRQAMYSCGWESRYDHSVRKTLTVMLLRASRPIVVRTMFRTVCLEALADVFHQAYAIFSLINAALN